MIKLAVSSCLLGLDVRYDGGNKFMPLKKFFPETKYSLTGICPEVEMGLGIPRKPIQINIDRNHKIQLVQVENQNITYHQRMHDWFCKNRESLIRFSGFILKSKSPSCGNNSTPHFFNDTSSITGDGLFTHLLKTINPSIAIIDETQLNKPPQLEKFKSALQLKTVI